MIQLKLAFPNAAEKGAVHRLHDVFRAAVPTARGSQMTLCVGGQLLHEPLKESRRRFVIAGPDTSQELCERIVGRHACRSCSEPWFAPAWLFLFAVAIFRLYVKKVQDSIRFAGLVLILLPTR